MLVQKAEFLVVNTDGTEHRIIATTAGRASDAFEVSGNRVRQVTLDHEVQNYEKDFQVFCVENRKNIISLCNNKSI